MSAFLRKYGTGADGDVTIPMVVRAAVDHATSSDWTPAIGDVTISKDKGARANIATLPTYTNGDWVFVFSDAELQCKRLSVKIVDSPTKVVEDQEFLIETYGHASAMYQADLSAANLPANIIQLGSSTQSATDLKDFADTGYDPVAHKVAGVVLVDTTTANTDMRGTDSAALATELAKVPKSDGTVAFNATAVGGIQTGLATPTNITAGIITTVTNLTNAPTNGDFTATMKTSITTAATSATPSVTVSDKTGFSLSSAGVQAIWGALTSALTTVGSVGKLIVDNLNATISSRLASASYTAPLDAAGTRTAVGLASANLDTQLAAIPTDADVQTAAAAALTAYDPPTRTEATTDKDAILTRLGTPTGTDVSTDIAAVKAGTLTAAAKAKIDRSAIGICTGTVGVGSTTTSIVTSALSPAGSVADQFKGRIVIFDDSTTTAALRGQATDITASSNAALAVLTVTALTTAPASTDTFTIT